MKYIILFFTLLIFFNSCISKKKKNTDATIKTILADTIPLVLIDTFSGKVIIDSTMVDSTQLVLKRNILPKTISFIDTIETLSMKGNFDYAAAGKSFQAGIYIRIQKDTIMWISITYLGFEIARILATPNEIQVYNKVNGKIESMSFSQLLAQQNLPLNFANPFQVIQSFLLGSFLLKHTDSIQSIPKTNDYLLFNTLPKPPISTLTTISLKDKVYYPISIQIPEVLNYILQINYDDWNVVKQNKYFSMSRKLLLYDIGNIQRPVTALSIYLTDAKFNEKVSFPFPKIESAYKP